MLDGVFGVGRLAVPVKGECNNVTGALAYNGGYDVFERNFRSLLNDLKSKYPVDSIKQAIVEVSDTKNWQGAYAELVALSVLNNGYSGIIKIDETLKEGMGFARECGKKLTNEDGWWKDFDVYFDVKILSDPIKEILDGIIKRAQQKANVAGTCCILPEYPLDDDDEEYKKNLRSIEQELIAALNKRETMACVSTLRHLSFRIHWGRGINTAVSTYSPFRHAEHTKDIVLKRYANKLLKSRPFFLVFVNFPWFNQSVTDFANMNEVYYRALSRRTFMQYEHTRAKASEIVDGYIGKETKRRLARCLTGIIFIEDHSITEVKNKYRTFVYLNPNAYQKSNSFRSYLNQLPNEAVDDFQDDNY